MSKLTGSEVYR